MASALKNLSEYNSDNLPDVSGKRFGIVVAEWNKDITDALCKGAFETLQKHGVKPENIHRNTVPGSYELTFGAHSLARKEDIDAIICLGAVIKGETRHDEYINSAVAQGLMHVSLMHNKPVIFGVLTVENMQQALDRAGGQHGNKGVEAAITAIHMLAF